MFLGNPKLDEIIYYMLFLLHWVFEMLTTAGALFLASIVPIYFFVYYFQRKPANLRVVLVLVSLKLLWLVLRAGQVYGEDFGFTCDLSGGSRLKYGPCESSMLTSGLFTIHLLRTVVLRNQALTPADTLLVKLQLFSGLLVYVTYNVRLH